MLQLYVKQLFSIQQLKYIRLQQANKLCLKNKYKFLLYQVTPLLRVNNTLMMRGNFKLIFYKLNFSYNFFLDLVEEKKISIYSLFFFTLDRDLMFYNLDYALFSWGSLINTLFKLDKIKIRKNYKLWVRYILPLRRYLLVWRWLGTLCRFLNINFNSIFLSFVSLWHEFFLQPVSYSKLNKLKIFTYKVYLYKLY